MNTDPQSVQTQLIFVIDQGKAFTVDTFPLSINLFKLAVLTQQTFFGKPVFFQQNYADKRLRPRALRALKIARPARVLMRARNPWARLRLILLG